MNASHWARIGLVVAVAVGVAILGPVVDATIWPDGSESISGNLNMMVLVGGVGIIAAIVAKSRQRPVALADTGTRAAALNLQAPAGQAQLLVYRDDRMGAQIGADLFVDDARIVQLTSPRFTCVALAPGEHRIAVDFQGRRAEHTLQARAGQVLALHLRMKMALTTTNPSLEPVSPEQAREAIGAAPMALPPAPTTATTAQA